MNGTELIQPLRDVWLRPRRVFRELAQAPLGPTDIALAALQGVCNYLLYVRFQPPDPNTALSLSPGSVLLYGSFTGLLVTCCYTLVYAQIAARIGRPLGRAPVFHVLSYGNVPVVAALLLSLACALLVGEAVLKPPALDADGFVWIVTRLQLAGVGLLYVWSYLLQVMGFSELFAVPLHRAFGLWLLGQLLGALAALLVNLFLAVLYQALVPGS